MQDLTGQVTWSSDADAHATVSAAGLVTAVALGTAKITATLGAISGSTTGTVTDKGLGSIAITPPNASPAAGRTLQLTAPGTFTDASPSDLTNQVTWASDATQFVTVDATGRASAVDLGTATISATLGPITGTTQLTTTGAELVSIAVTAP